MWLRNTLDTAGYGGRGHLQSEVFIHGMFGIHKQFLDSGLCPSPVQHHQGSGAELGMKASSGFHKQCCTLACSNTLSSKSRGASDVCSISGALLHVAWLEAKHQSHEFSVWVQTYAT